MTAGAGARIDTVGYGCVIARLDGFNRRHPWSHNDHYGGGFYVICAGSGPVALSTWGAGPAI